jgi:NifU-like protein involved in Fe-S cluster formation
MSELYHPRILELAAEAPQGQALAAPHGTARKVSRVCGSEVEVALTVENGVIDRIAVDAQACALGQASAAILALAGVGASAEDVHGARDALLAMLKHGGAPPKGRFWELRHLQGVRDFPQRHASTMLAWDAAVEALDQALQRSPA